MIAESALEKQRVLFVDDEPGIIDGFRRILRRHRNRWELDFAHSGDHAMAMLAQNPYDIVISDIRMPGMHGVELLDRIKQNYPDTLRIVVSGHADMELTLESARVAHQFIAKPVESDVLLGRIERSLALRSLLRSRKLRELVASIGNLPSLPVLYEELVRCIREDRISLSEIGRIIQKDPAMSARILQMVNSAFFGLARQVVSPADAASILGINTIKQLVLVIKVFDIFKDANVDLHIIGNYLNKSQRIALLARNIAAREGMTKVGCDSAQLAGSMVYLGHLMAANFFPNEFRQVKGFSQELLAGERTDELEDFVLGCRFNLLGAYLLGIWSLPDQVAEAVAYYTAPAESNNFDFSPLTAVHIAEALISRLDETGELSQDIAGLDMDYLERVPSKTHLNQWCEEAEKLLREG